MRPWLIGLWVLIALAGVATAMAGKGRGPAMVVSVSSDGHYAVSSHRNRDIMLWDLTRKTARVIAHNANIYSAYFVKGRGLIVWQGLDKKVHVQSVSGKTLETFMLPFDVYGNLMTKDLKTYIASDSGWGIHLRQNGRLRTLKREDKGAFTGYGKLLNLSYDAKQHLLLSAGDSSPYYGTSPYFSVEKQKKQGYAEFNGVTLWNTHTLQPIAKLPGNIAKTYATFSPDGRYVVSVDETGKPLFWNASTYKLKYWLGRAGLGVWNGHRYDNSGGIDLPKDYIDPGHDGAILTSKFITKNKFITINTYEPFAFLYSVTQQQPLKYFSLGTKPFPSVSAYDRNAAIDTAPDAGILVIGQRDGNGIIVYRYDDKARTLKKVWVTQ